MRLLKLHRLRQSMLLLLICLFALPLAWWASAASGDTSRPGPQVETSRPAPAEPQAGTDGGVWTLDFMYISLRADDDRERKDVPNSSGGTLSHSANWTDYQGHTYEGKTTLTFSMPQSIPADGEADITSSATAEWTSAGMTGRRDAKLWVSGTGPAEGSGCYPFPFVREDNAQGRSVKLAGGPHRCTIKPSTLPAGSNQFWITFNVQTQIDNPGLVVPTVHKLEIFVSALFRFCASARDCRSIEGNVFAVPPDDQRYALNGVPVTLLRNGQFLRQTITEPPDGHYILNHVPITTSLTLSVTLRHDANVPSPFQVQYGWTGVDPVFVATAPFSTSAQTPVEVMDIGLAPGFQNPPLSHDPAVPADILDDLGIIYYHTWQAWALTDEVVGQKLDLQPPLEIVGFSLKPPPDDGVYFVGPKSDGIANANVQPNINIDVNNSWFSDGARPKNREYHEFGHYVMTDALGNLAPFYHILPNGPRDSGHGGYSNPSSTDSWFEGFAEFYAMLVAQYIGGDQRPELYTISATWPENLESNSLAWRFRYSAKTNRIQWLEELAVAGLLWDLVDPVDAGDSSPLGGVDYADCVDIHYSTLWDLVTTNWQDAPTPSVFRRRLLPAMATSSTSNNCTRF